MMEPVLGTGGTTMLITANKKVLTHRIETINLWLVTDRSRNVRVAGRELREVQTEGTELMSWAVGVERDVEVGNG